jgi:hypothetical protein
MKFDRILGYAQFARNLLIQYAGDNPLHDFLLACGQRFIAPPQVMNFRLLLSGTPIAFDSLPNRFEEILLLDWLGQKLNRARFHCLHGGWDVAMACEKDDWDVQPQLRHSLLEMKPAQSRELQVQYETTWSVSQRPSQKFLR